jgi:PAS domain S-box-containing protein
VAHRDMSDGTVMRLWQRIGRWLTEPSAAIQDRESRRQARLLVTMLLALFLLVAGAIFVSEVMAQGREAPRDRNVLLSTAALAPIMGFYLLSRTRHYVWIGYAVVGLISVLVFLAAVPDGNPDSVNLLVYLVIPVVLSSVLLPYRATIILIALQSVGVLAFPLVAGMASELYGLATFVFFVSVMMLLGTRHVVLAEKERRADLAESERRYQTLFEEIDDVVLVHDLEGNILDVNEAASRRLGFTRDELLHMKTVDIDAPDYGTQYENRLARQQSEGGLREIGGVHIAKNGRRIVIDSNTKLINYRGEPAILAVCRDISERARVEAVLHDSETRTRAILSAFPDLIFRLSADGTFLDYEVAEGQINHYVPANEILGRNLDEVLPPEMAEAFHRSVQSAVSSRNLQTLEYQLPRAGGVDGPPRHFEVRAVPLGEDEVLAIVRDITSLKQAQEALRENDAKYRSLFEDAPIALWEEDFSEVKRYLDDLRAQGISDLESHFDRHPEAVTDCIDRLKIIDINRTTLALFGMGEKTGLHEELKKTLSGEAFDAFKQELLVLSRGQKRFQRVSSIHTGTGGQRFIVVSVWIAPGYEDTWSRVFVSEVDITERHRIAEAEHDQRMLAEALRDTAAAINRTLNQDEALDRILTNIGRVVPHDAANVSLLDEGVARIVRQRGYDRYGMEHFILALRLKAEDYPTLRRMIETRQPVCISDIETDPEWVGLDSRATMRSYVGAPMCWEGQVIGFLNLQSTTPGFFNSTHAERLRAFADQAAIAISNAQLYDAVHRHVAELEALRRVTLDITAQLDLDALLQELLKSALKLLGVGSGGIYLYRPDQDVLEWVVRVGPQTAPPGSQLHRGEGLSGKVWEQGTALWVDNYSEWEGRAPLYNGFKWTAIIGVPISWQGQLLGVINAVSDASERTFSERDAQLLGLFANQAAIAIRNAQLFAEEQKQHALSDALRSIAGVINGTLDLDEVLDHILTSIKRVVPHDAANIMLVEGDIARVVGSRGYGKAATEEWLRSTSIPVDSRPILRHIGETGQVYVIPYTRTDPLWVEVAEVGWIQSHIACPIRVEGRLIGALNLDSAVPGAFDHTHAETLQAFVDQAAIAVNNARLYAEVRRYTDELEQRVAERTVDLSVRNAVAETLSSSLDMGEMLNGVLRTTVEQLGVMGGGIYLLSEDSTSLEMAAHWGVAADTLNLVTGIYPGGPDMRLPWSDLSEPIQEVDLVRQTGISAVLSVPIWRQEQVQGVITLVNAQPRPWHHEEVRMLDAIGRQIGVALANARLYAEAVRGEARILTILENVVDGLLVFDQNNTLTMTNRAAEALFSFYSEEHGGAGQAATLLWQWLQSHSELPFAPRSIEFALPTVPLASEAGHAAAAQCLIRGCAERRSSYPAWPCWLLPGGPDDEELRQCAIHRRLPHRAVQAQCAEVRDAAGQVLGTVVTLHDVTYFRELDDLKGRFVSTVSHELRTPLSAVLLQISTLLKYYDRFSDHERRTMIGEVQQQAHVLRELIEDILELSRLDARRSLPQKQWFDLVSYCTEVVNALRPALDEKHLSLDRTQCTGSRYILADPNQVMRVLRNLLSNAIKYTPDGGQITLRLDQAGDKVRLSVTDTGIGITREQQMYIFDRFFRAEEASRMASGTGLGLSITKEIVDLHGGRIELQSTPGEGSTFTVYLPISGDDRL